MKSLQIDGRRRRFRLVASENSRRAFEQLTAPLRDLVRVDVKLLRQFGQCLLLQPKRSRFSEIAANATFALKVGMWFRRARFVICAPELRLFSPLSGRKSTYRPVQSSGASSHSLSLIILHVY